MPLSTHPNNCVTKYPCSQSVPYRPLIVIGECRICFAVLWTIIQGYSNPFPFNNTTLDLLNGLNVAVTSAGTTVKVPLKMNKVEHVFGATLTNDHPMSSRASSQALN